MINYNILALKVLCTFYNMIMLLWNGCFVAEVTFKPLSKVAATFRVYSRRQIHIPGLAFSWAQDPLQNA